MRKWMTLHAAPLCACICIVMLAGAFVGVGLSADAGTYRIDDIEGDAAYLDGVLLSMRLEDAAHTQHLKLTDGVLSHTYVYSSPIGVKTGEPWFFGSQTFVEHEDADVQISLQTELEDADDTFEFWVKRMTRTAGLARVSVAIDYNDGRTAGYDNTKYVQVVTDITVRDENRPFSFVMEGGYTVSKNQISPQGDRLPDEVSEWPFSDAGTEIDSDIYTAEAGMASVLCAQAADGTVYFTPALRSYHGGVSAIYRVDVWGGYGAAVEPTYQGGFLRYPMFAETPSGSVTQVVSFPVEGRDIQTGALDVVDDKLCLLLVEHGTLWLRVYLRDGTLQHETALMQISPDSDTQYYMLYANKSDGSTMLCYHLCNVTTADMQTEEQLLLCVELGEKATLRSVITPRDGVLHAAFIGGRWVLVEYNTTLTVNWPTSAPVYHYVSVLDDAGQTLYRGEIVTDAAEDVRQYYEIIAWEGTVEWYQEPYITDRYGYGADYTLTRGLYCDEISEG